jgi:hypothetical protein
MQHQPFIRSVLFCALAAIPAALLILSGTAQADTVNTANNVTVSSGNYSDGNEGYTNAGTGLIINGGTFDDNTVGFENNTAASATINGGSFNGNSIAGVLNFGTLNITGGDFTGNGVFDIEDVNTGVTDIYGTYFSTGFGDLAPGRGTFTGTLEDGQTETLSYRNGGSIDLINSAPAPELGSSVSFGLLLVLGGAALAVRSRKLRVGTDV